MMYRAKRLLNEIYLRELEMADASPKYSKWLSDKKINRFLETKKATVDELKEFILSKQENPASLLFGVFLQVNDQHIGNVLLEPIQWCEKKARIGIMIGDRRFLGRGYGTQAIMMATEKAFKEFGLQKLYLGVHRENIPAIISYLKAGFIISGMDAMARHRDGSTYVKIIMKKDKKA